MKNSPRFLLLFFLCVACLCAGCTTRNPNRKPSAKAVAAQEEELKKESKQHRLVGTIVLVNLDQHFVLIDTGSSYPAAAGTALKSFADGSETGVLAVSPEVKAPFMIADIVSGTPHKGDQVFE